MKIILILRLITKFFLADCSVAHDCSLDVSQLVGSPEIGSVAQTSTAWVALICYWHFCVISSLLLTPAFGIISVDLITALIGLLASPDITKVPTKFPKGWPHAFSFLLHRLSRNLRKVLLGLVVHYHIVQVCQRIPSLPLVNQGA